MTSLRFSKMHGAGNDFIVASDPDSLWPRDPGFIRRICDRRRGIGADGLILLAPARNPALADLAMAFFNCDGSRADMCGNGLRCAALYAHVHMDTPCELRIATDVGVLAASVLPEADGVRIQIPVLAPPRPVDVPPYHGWFVNTGVPHLVIPIDVGLAELDIAAVAPPLRHHPRFAPAGCNVDFVNPLPDKPVFIRTFERGVEAETLACGTGIAAAALALAAASAHPVPLLFQTVAGDILAVDVSASPHQRGHVQLTGPAVEVFTGLYSTGRM
jgi:diaminopimelate epimerase